MSPEQQDPPEVQRIRKALEAVHEAASHLEVKKAAPDPAKQRDIEDLDEIRRQTEQALADLASWEHGQHAVGQIVTALNRSTATLVTAMNANAGQIGAILSEQGGPAFEADPEVLAEGEFLKAQLTGVEGTEGRGPLFKDAPTALPISGLDLLTESVNPPDQSYEGPTQ